MFQCCFLRPALDNERPIVLHTDTSCSRHLPTFRSLTMPKQNSTANSRNLSADLHPCQQHFCASQAPSMCTQTCQPFRLPPLHDHHTVPPSMHLPLTPPPSPLMTPPPEIRKNDDVVEVVPRVFTTLLNFHSLHVQYHVRSRFATSSRCFLTTICTSRSECCNASAATPQMRHAP